MKGQKNVIWKYANADLAYKDVRDEYVMMILNSISHDGGTVDVHEMHTTITITIASGRYKLCTLRITKMFNPEHADDHLSYSIIGPFSDKPMMSDTTYLESLMYLLNYEPIIEDDEEPFMNDDQSAHVADADVREVVDSVNEDAPKDVEEKKIEFMNGSVLRCSSSAYGDVYGGIGAFPDRYRSSTGGPLHYTPHVTTDIKQMFTNSHYYFMTSEVIQEGRFSIVSSGLNLLDTDIEGYSLSDTKLILTYRVTNLNINTLLTGCVGKDVKTDIIVNNAMGDSVWSGQIYGRCTDYSFSDDYGRSGTMCIRVVITKDISS